MKNDVFIFSIAYNCGLILDKCLESFFKYHTHKVHVFGMPNDFKPLKKYADKVEFIELSSDNELREYYKHGHLGTAYIWAGVLSGKYTDSQYVIQIDSDTFFMGTCVPDIMQAFSDGYDLIGPRRAYKNNKCGRNDVRNLPDVVSTYLVGVNRNKITKRDFGTLQRMAAGHYNPLEHPILDFFDPVSFEIINNGGKIMFLDKEQYGSMDENGNNCNSFGELNSIMDCGDKIIHFAGIGSGMNFHKNGNGSVPASYAEWAKKRFALYMKLLHDSDVGEYDVENIEKIRLVLNKNIES